MLRARVDSWDCVGSKMGIKTNVLFRSVIRVALSNFLRARVFYAEEIQPRAKHPCRSFPRLFFLHFIFFFFCLPSIFSFFLFPFCAPYSSSSPTEGEEKKRETMKFAAEKGELKKNLKENGAKDGNDRNKGKNIANITKDKNRDRKDAIKGEEHMKKFGKIIIIIHILNFYCFRNSIW